MSSTMTTTLGTSQVRTSLRQTRTNPTRTSKTIGSSLRQHSLMNSAPGPAPSVQEHGFYPAITHFTDAIAALPREFRRHTSLLKEVDAKAWAPEAHLQTLLAACVTAKPPIDPQTDIQSTREPTTARSGPSLQPFDADGNAVPAVDHPSAASAQSHLDLHSFEQRRLFYHLRGTLTEMMVSMDEKNHLINSANEDISRHLKRLTSIYPHIAGEVSEEARLGSLRHWAYVENRPPTRANVASSRREAAAGLAAMHDTDIASRSESRREAILARKQKQNQVDSDFDDPRSTKRASVNGKSKRVGEIAAESVPGLGISGVAPGVKRKRAEKPAAGGMAMERSLSGPSGGRALSREPSQQEGTKKRKAPTSATTAARKRINTTNSATDSPKPASSPLVGSFGKDASRNSPMPGNVRPQSARARQNSAQGRPPSSTSNKNNGIGGAVPASAPELRNVSTLAGKVTDELRSARRESISGRGERPVEEGSGAIVDGTNGTRAGVFLERSNSKGGASSLKREEASAAEENLSSKVKPAASPRLPPATRLNADLNATASSTRPEREREQRPSRSRSSKTSTPVVNTFAESEMATRDTHRTDTKFKRPPSSSSRSARNKDLLHDSLSPSGLPLKRSHKKGAGFAAQAAAALQANQTKQNSVRGDAPASNNNTSNHNPNTHQVESYHHNPNRSNPPPSPNMRKSAEAGPGNGSALRNKDGDGRTENEGDGGGGGGGGGEEEEGEDEEDDDEIVDSSGEEPRYCYCQNVSYGEMVACDAEDCPREWFHLECVGLGRAPGRNARWFCEECKERLEGVGKGDGGNAGNGGVGESGGLNGSGGGNETVNGDGDGDGNGNGSGNGNGNGNVQAVGGRRGR